MRTTRSAGGSPIDCKHVDLALYAKMFAVEKPYWWSVGTREIFHDWLAPVVADRNARLLDLGCGTGAFTRELAAIGSVGGVDVSAQKREDHG